LMAPSFSFAVLVFPLSLFMGDRESMRRASRDRRKSPMSGGHPVRHRRGVFRRALGEENPCAVLPLRALTTRNRTSLTSYSR
jgi:hypothetical protein